MSIIRSLSVILVLLNSQEVLLQEVHDNGVGLSMMMNMGFQMFTGDHTGDEQITHETTTKLPEEDANKNTVVESPKPLSTEILTTPTTTQSTTNYPTTSPSTTTTEAIPPCAPYKEYTVSSLDKAEEMFMESFANLTFDECCDYASRYEWDSFSHENNDCRVYLYSPYRENVEVAAVNGENLKKLYLFVPDDSACYWEEHELIVRSGHLRFERKFDLEIPEFCNIYNCTAGNIELQIATANEDVGYGFGSRKCIGFIPANGNSNIQSVLAGVLHRRLRILSVENDKENEEFLSGWIEYHVMNHAVDVMEVTPYSGQYIWRRSGMEVTGWSTGAMKNNNCVVYGMYGLEDVQCFNINSVVFEVKVI